MSKPTEMTLKNVRASYVFVFGNGRTSTEGKRSWSINLLIPKNHPQVEQIKACINAAKSAYAEKIGKGAVRSPLLDGDAKDEDGNYKYLGDEHRGHYFLRASNYNRRPPVVDKNVQPIMDPDELYSGCFVNARLSFFGYNAGTNRGISPGLDAVQKVKEGDRLSGGGVRAEDVFTAVEEDFLS